MTSHNLDPKMEFIKNCGTCFFEKAFPKEYPCNNCIWPDTIDWASIHPSKWSPAIRLNIKGEWPEEPDDDRDHPEKEICVAEALEFNQRKKKCDKMRKWY